VQFLPISILYIEFNYNRQSVPLSIKVRSWKLQSPVKCHYEPAKYMYTCQPASGRSLHFVTSQPTASKEGCTHVSYKWHSNEGIPAHVDVAADISYQLPVADQCSTQQATFIFISTSQTSATCLHAAVRQCIWPIQWLALKNCRYFCFLFSLSNIKDFFPRNCSV